MVGSIAGLSSYYYEIEIPYVGEYVVVYGTLRIIWDVSYNLDAEYGPVTTYLKYKNGKTGR